jgi:predicted Zn-dependent peptidase
MFENEDGVDTFSRFAKYGASANAYTSATMTAYLFSCTNHLTENLEILLDYVSKPYFTPENVEKERGIIAQEIRMYEDQPWERAYSNMLSALFHSHPIRRRICGSVASIGKITPALLRRAYDAYYRLSNMALIVCGDVTEEEILSTVSEVLGECGEGAPAPKREKIYETGGAYRTRVTAKMQVAKPLFCIGIKDGAVPNDARELLRRDLLMTVLCEMLFSRSGDFYSDLFESGLVSPGMSYGSSVGRGFGFYALSGEADDPDAVMAAFRAYIDRLHKEGLCEAEFERSRRILYADYVTGFDSTEDIATSLCNYALEGVELFDFLPIVEGMTYAEVCALFEDTFREGQYVLSVVEPLGEYPNEENKEEKEGG